MLCENLGVFLEKSGAIGFIFSFLKAKSPTKQAFCGAFERFY
jgi:hypothetical protein